MDPRKLLAGIAVLILALLMACGEEAPREEAVVVEETIAEEGVAVVQEAPAMTDEQKMAYVMEHCICPRCPSWVPEAAEKGEGGYCATGVSECIVVESGCVCPDCPVTTELGLTWGYYCTRGAAADMMAAEAAAVEAVPE